MISRVVESVKDRASSIGSMLPGGGGSSTPYDRSDEGGGTEL